MEMKYIRIAPVRRDLAQTVYRFFRSVPAVGKDQTFAAVYLPVQEIPFFRIILKDFQGQGQFTGRAGQTGAGDLPAAAGAKPPGRLGIILQRGGQADPARQAAADPFQPGQQALQLQATVCTGHGMKLVDHHKAQVGKQDRGLFRMIRQKRFQGFRRDLDDAFRAGQRRGPGRTGRFSVPGADGDVAVLQQQVQPLELVIDQGPQRADIKDGDRSGRIFAKQCQHRKKGSFRFAGSCA